MEQSQELIIQKDDSGVLWLTLNRPERRNALSPALYEALYAALVQAEQDNEIGTVVLTGAGAGFCAGGDVSRMNQARQHAGSESERISALRQRTRIVERLHNMPKPTIAMIRGAAVGAGLSLALACDLRYGDPSAKFRTGFVNVGLPGDFGGHYFLPRIVGPAKARELYLRSSMLAADQAARIGLLNQVFSAEALEMEVASIACAIAQGPQPAIRNIKANLNDGLALGLSDLLDQECIRHVECADSPDHKEAVRAFVDKRSSVFTHAHTVEAGASTNGN